MEHSDHRLYLIFEWLDKDLKNYMDSVPGGMSDELVKVRVNCHRVTSSDACHAAVCCSRTCTNCFSEWTSAIDEASCIVI